MSQVVWRIAADTRAYEAHDLTGAGPKLTGGRWNETGVAVVYAAESRALACLETSVHLNSGGLPLNRYLVEITIPDPIWAAAKIENASGLPVGWDAEPAARASISLGSRWAQAKSTAVLRVPSVIVPEESNVVINPAHPDAAGIKARKVRRWLYDPRLAKGRN